MNGRQKAGRKYYERVTRERRESGLCTTCGSRLKSGEVRCKKCRNSSTTTSSKRYAKLKSSGLCVRCKKAVRPNETTCDSCRLIYKGYESVKFRKRNELGKCAGCGRARDRDGLKTCSRCAEKQKKHADARAVYCRNNKLCFQCKEPSVLTECKRLLCLECWFKATASNNLKDRDRWTDLRDLWNECEGRCAYTGDKLTPGKNCSIDHKIPTSRFGGHEKDNLQWVLFGINMMKRDMTHEEFVWFCKAIANNF